MPLTSNQRALVVANITAMSDELLIAMHEREERGPTTFTLIVPATAHGGGLTAAGERLHAALERLRDAGLHVDGRVADGDPLWAVQENWDPRRYDEIILCTLPMPVSKWLHHGLPQRVADLTGAFVTHVVAQPAKAQAHVDHVASGGQVITGALSPLHALEGLWPISNKPSERV
jgi:hypothetical protein